MSAIVTLAGDQAVTNTMAIATGTETQHKNVLELVRTYKADLEEFGRVAFETLPLETAGGTQRREVAILNEQQSTLLLTYMRNSDIVRAFKKRLVREFWEMRRAGTGLPVPQTLPEALRLAADLAEQKAEAERQLALAAPKVEFADTMLNADGTTLVRDVAKTIGVGVRKLEKALRSKGVILPNNAPAAIYVSKGYFKEATHTFETNTKGTQLSHTARVTGLGIEFLRRFAARHSDLLGGAS